MARHYEEDFKKQIVEIFNQGNYTYKKLGEEYAIAPSTIRLRKKLKQLEMENDILKQAALLLGKK